MAILEKTSVTLTMIDFPVYFALPGKEKKATYLCFGLPFVFKNVSLICIYYNFTKYSYYYNTITRERKNIWSYCHEGLAEDVFAFHVAD